MALVPLASGQTAISEAGTSEVWADFTRQRQQKQTTQLPDYSWAGYAHGERGIPSLGGPLFDVTDYGATPNDQTDDRDGIQHAIDAAEAAGGGVVYLPAGRYLVNTDMADHGRLTIDASGVVLRGAGSREGGTIIHQVHPFGGGNPHDSSRLHLGDTIILARSPEEPRWSSQAPLLCRVAKDSSPGSFAVVVDNVELLHVGDEVYLHARNKTIFEDLIHPLKLEPEWTNATQNKARCVEVHTIVSIEGTTVTFAEPTHYPILARYGWDLRRRQAIREVGIEDIAFMGNAWHRYEHHRSGMDDSGWAAIEFEKISQSYVRRCSFINVSQGVYVGGSANVSLLNLTFAGAKAHHSTRVGTYSFNVWIGLTDDQTGFTHGPSLQGGSVGTVYWGWNGLESPIDLHAGRPFNSLFDCVHVSRISSGGGRRDYPKHLTGLTLWNVKINGDASQSYDFWEPSKSDAVARPWIVGMHGTQVILNEKQAGRIESLDQSVEPESLYEAQLELRRSVLPEWLSKAKLQRRELDAIPLPDYFICNDLESPVALYIEKIQIDAMLDYLTSLSLQSFNSELFISEVETEGLTLNSDQAFVRHGLYSLMCVIYQRQQKGNSIIAQSAIVNGGPGVRFILSSSKIDGTSDKFLADPSAADAQHIFKRIGGTLKVHNFTDSLQFIVDIPSLK